MAVLSVSRTDIFGKNISPWLIAMRIEFQVVGDEIQILRLPPSIKLVSADYWPMLVSTTSVVGDHSDYDVMADINPDTGEMNVQGYWRKWIEEDEI